MKRRTIQRTLKMPDIICFCIGISSVRMLYLKIEATVGGGAQKGEPAGACPVQCFQGQAVWYMRRFILC